jgi:hypothetical protein
MEVAVLWDVTTLSGGCLLMLRVEQFPTVKTEVAHLPQYTELHSYCRENFKY